MALYTAPEILLFIAAIGTLIVNSIYAWRTGTAVQQTLTKTSIIEGHVNSKETKYVEQITSLGKEIDLLKQVIINNEKTAALLAQAVVQVKAIEKNTESIDINTKKEK